MAPNIPLSLQFTNSGGSPRTSSSCATGPVVIVIGAGFAGLAAARALRNASFQVIVLESRDRVGGRVHTDYSFGFPVDMGASWLHGVCHANPLATLISRLQLPLYRTSGDDSVLYDHDLESYALFENDGKQVERELVAGVGEVFEEMLEETRKVRDEAEEDMCMRAAFEIVLERRPELRLEGVRKRVLQWYICRMEGWFAADVEKLSLRHWDEEELLDGGHGLMVKGYWPVLTALSAGLDIRHNHRVTSIARHSSGAAGGVTISTEDGQSLHADAAVVTVPVGVLQAGSLAFAPPLPAWKASAIADIGVGNENKIALHFAEAFWPGVEFLGVVAPTSYECSYFLNLHKATGSPVLMYMPAGSLADDLEKLSDEAAAAFAMSQLRRICPGAQEPLHYRVSHWGTDPSSLGCYTYDRVGKAADVYDRLRAPLEPLFFAGEATSRDFPGTVHGAYATGLRAAEECRHMLAASSAFADFQLFAPASAKEIGAADAMLMPLQISRM